MLCVDDLSELPCDYVPQSFLVREAVQRWERDEAHALRRAVFCLEQGLVFHGRVGDDRDAVDEHAQLLVAMACVGGMPDQVVGTVRIHRGRPDGADAELPGLWSGSRLAVHAAWRQQGALGATLIRLAVSRAHALGCDTFLAHVQAQNVSMFEKLHWHVERELLVHGRPHALMRADLAHYPPCHDPVSGYVSVARPRKPGAEVR